VNREPKIKKNDTQVC